LEHRQPRHSGNSFDFELSYSLILSADCINAMIFRLVGQIHSCQKAIQTRVSSDSYCPHRNCSFACKDLKFLSVQIIVLIVPYFSIFVDLVNFHLKINPVPHYRVNWLCQGIFDVEINILRNYEIPNWSALTTSQLSNSFVGQLCPVLVSWSVCDIVTSYYVHHVTCHVSTLAS